MNLVDHIHIYSEDALMNCEYYYPNATKLTLPRSFNERCVQLGTLLRSIIPLNQLATLVIENDKFCFEELIELLHFAPNIHTLKFYAESISESKLTLIQQSQIFQLVSNTNKIRNVIVKDVESTENIKLFV